MSECTITFTIHHNSTGQLKIPDQSVADKPKGKKEGTARRGGRKKGRSANIKKFKRKRKVEESCNS